MITLNDYRPGYRDLFTNYLAREQSWDEDYAVAVTDSALEFLTVCAEHPGELLVSADDTDHAIDAIVRDTELLRWLENGPLGRTVVHIPNYVHDPIERARQDVAYSITVAYLRERGPIDPRIWRDRSAGCWTSCRVVAA